MAQRSGLKEVEAGHWYATVNGVQYEMLKARQAVPPRIVWDLFRVVDGEREFIERAPTLEAHRQTLAEQAEPPLLRRRIDPKVKQLIDLVELKVSMDIAHDQAAALEIPEVLRDVQVARGAIATAIETIKGRQDAVVDAMVAEIEQEVAA